MCGKAHVLNFRIVCAASRKVNVYDFCCSCFYENNRSAINMKWKSSSGWKNWLLVIFLVCTVNARSEVPAASFAYFDAKARQGNPMSVVFFGGSLTWGDGASDPERTSYRALMQNYLQGKYPSSHFTFYDAAIGGTGSKLGMFRIERDVLSRKPDLVFLDFTIEDDLDGTDRETLGSYERTLRDLIFNGIPVVQVLAGTKNYFGPDWKHLGPPRFRDHLEMGSLYRTAIGNSFPVIQNFLRNELHSRAEIWPGEEIHPNDLGHRFIFEAARTGLEQAIREKRICNFSENSVFAGEYKNRLQLFPGASPLPPGWRLAKTLRPAFSAVEIANGWMDKVAVSSIQHGGNREPIRIHFNGTFLGILGESDEHGLAFKVFIDGKVVLYENSMEENWPTSTVPFGGGERFFWHVISDKLRPGRHTAEIYPVFPEGVEKGELRLESICTAGPDAEAVQNILATPIPF